MQVGERIGCLEVVASITRARHRLRCTICGAESIQYQSQVRYHERCPSCPREAPAPTRSGEPVQIGSRPFGLQYRYPCGHERWIDTMVDLAPPKECEECAS